MTDKFQTEAERHVKTCSIELSTNITADLTGADVGAQLTMTLSSALTCSYMLTPELPERVEGPPGWPVDGIEETSGQDCFLNLSTQDGDECTSVAYHPYGSSGLDYQERIFAH